MKIIKNGDISRLRKHIEFLCVRCECQFIADDTEYEYASQMELMHDGIVVKCKCPTCGYMVYKHRSRI